MTTFALIRHASHGLVGHTIVGRMPGVPLSLKGRDEAAALARQLEGSPIQALYSSPLERARATAAHIADGLCLEVQIAEELNEIDYGQWTNRALAELRDIPEWRRFNRFRSGSPIPDGESMIEVQDRMLRLIEHLCATHPEQMVALVSHGDVIKATLAYYLGVPLDLFQRIEISPASLSIVRVERYGPEVLLINGLVEERLLQSQIAAPGPTHDAEQER
ncbi:MAG TPA: histidine phosphatase family protein [Geminicoccaceae bacterium]|jgi:probable phosphoglycerate mutase|nr:histidine phosphatase family protein [Geminicoccaceae bacterium]